MAFTVKVIPYIVQVDKHGYEIAITQAPQVTPFEQKVVISRLGRFIIDMRTIIMDTTAQRRIITGLYTMIPSGQASYMKLNEYYRQNNPLEAASKSQTQEVEIKSILFLEGNTWQVEWTEKRYEKGLLTGEKAWKGFITIALNPTRDLQNIIETPLGVYVLDFNFSPNFNQDLK
jgi:type IV secretion system protein VirB5